MGYHHKIVNKFSKKVIYNSSEVLDYPPAMSMEEAHKEGAEHMTALKEKGYDIRFYYCSLIPFNRYIKFSNGSIRLL